MKNIPARRVIYIVGYPLGVRDAQRFGLAELQLAGLHVVVWDLSWFFLPAASELEIESPNGLDPTICSSVGGLRDVCDTVTSEDVIIFIDGLSSSMIWRHRKILRLIFATPARLTSASLGHVPVQILHSHALSSSRTNLARAFSLISNPRRWKTIRQRLASIVYTQVIKTQFRMRFRGSMRPLDHIWAGTQVSMDTSFLVASSTSVTYIHTLDYDLVLALRASVDHLTPRLVFIDSMGPLGPDYLLHDDLHSCISIGEYSEMVCRAIDEIEKRLGNEVVIAVHPRAVSGQMEPWYGGRTLIYGRTTELIANATAVIDVDGSTAIGLAAVFQRPLVLLSSSKTGFETQGRNKAFAQALDTPLIDLDSPELPPFILEVNESAYTEYVQKYIKRKGTPEEPFWSVVASEINS